MLFDFETLCDEFRNVFLIAFRNVFLIAKAISLRTLSRTVQDVSDMCGERNRDLPREMILYEPGTRIGAGIIIRLTQCTVTAMPPYIEQPVLAISLLKLLWHQDCYFTVLIGLGQFPILGKTGSDLRPCWPRSNSLLTS